MNKEEFFKFVEQNIKSHLPEEFMDAAITLRTQMKPNIGEQHGILITKPDESVAPMLYLERAYEEYAGNQDKVFQIMENIADEIVGGMNMATKEMKLDATQVQQYEWAKHHLQRRLYDYQDNAALMSDLVHTRQGDFALTYHVAIGEIASIPITNQLLDKWNVTKDQLHTDTMILPSRNNIPVLLSLEEVVMQRLRQPDDLTNYLEPGAGRLRVTEDSMYILTNESKYYGASMLMDQDILAQVGKLIRKDYYVLPSSLHEALIIPSDTHFSVKELNDMVRQINDKDVSPEDRLSNRVQYYDHNTHVLENAIAREERLQEDKKINTAGQEKNNKQAVSTSALARKEERIMPPKL